MKNKKYQKIYWYRVGVVSAYSASALGFIKIMEFFKWLSFANAPQIGLYTNIVLGGFVLLALISATRSKEFTKGLTKVFK